MIVSAAGMMAVWGAGGLAMLYVMLQPTSPLVPLAYAFAFVAFISNSMQLIPLLELDGYFLLMDWLELPWLPVLAVVVPLAVELPLEAVSGVPGVTWTSGVPVWLLPWWPATGSM